jgi:serine/threonine protein kinase
MLTGEPPWKANNIQNIVQLHMLLSTRKEEPPEINRDIPISLRDFLVVIFKKDPKERPTAEVLLTHHFLRFFRLQSY